MNEKIKELIDWCQEEIDYRIKVVKENSPNRQTALNQKTILDTVKDKLCSIYEDDTQMTRLKYVVTVTNKTEEELINEYCPTGFNVPVNISTLTICGGEYCDECIKCWNEEMCDDYSNYKRWLGK